jgi:hypothetical protein
MAALVTGIEVLDPLDVGAPVVRRRADGRPGGAAMPRSRQTQESPMWRTHRLAGRWSPPEPAHSHLRPAASFRPARVRNHARTVVTSDELLRRAGSIPLGAGLRSLGRVARPVRHTRRQLVANACRERVVAPKVRPSMTSRRRATKEIHHERHEAIHPLQLHELHELHELPRCGVHLRLPNSCRPGGHASRLRLRPAVPMRPGVQPRQVLIRAVLKAMPAARGDRTAGSR